MYKIQVKRTWTLSLFFIHTAAVAALMVHFGMAAFK